MSFKTNTPARIAFRNRLIGYFAGMALMIQPTIGLLAAEAPQSTPEPKSAQLPPASQQSELPLPTITEVQQTVAGHFSGLKGRRKGDLISQVDVADLFGKLEEIGWKVTDKRAILSRVLSDHDFLVRQLRTPHGMRFMRHISANPVGYDRLDRLRRMPYGTRRIRELINDPGGHTMINYMTTTEGGRNLGKYLSKDKRGRSFNQPTGKLYTAQQFVKQIDVSYRALQKPSPSAKS